jgi:formylglycine-generating enzyme required for sulfatase activity
VGRFQVANVFGLYDVHGNVLEWCEDNWHNDYNSAPEDGRAWLNDNDSQDKLLRGGSFLYNSGNCRSASRSDLNPVIRSLNAGFRVVAVPRI